MTPPDHESRSDGTGRNWDSPFLKPDPAWRPPVEESGAPPGVRRALILVIAVATAAAVWSLRGSLGFARAHEISLAGRAGLAAGTRSGELEAAPLPDSAAASRGRTALLTAADSADATAMLLLDPRRLIGTWHHGDATSQYGDSLVLDLRADGEALSAERRYLLDRKGWHVSRTSRTGSWTVRYRGTRPAQLCTSWRTPTAAEACDRIELLDDSTDGRMLLRFAGRHWTLELPSREADTPRVARPTRR